MFTEPRVQIDSNVQRQSTRFCVAFVALLFGTLLSIFAYYRFVDTRLVKFPYGLSVYDYQSKGNLRLDTSDRLCQDLLREAYCHEYYDCIIKNELPLTAYKTPVALPTLRSHNNVYMLNESMELRCELWRKAPPQVVLLGSSWMFQGFNRRQFFDRYPALRLLDFAVMHNTPETTKLLLEELNGHHCSVPAGTIFVYGINLVELASWYPGIPPGVLQQALTPTPNRFKRELDLFQAGMNDIRDQARGAWKALMPAPAQSHGRPYLFEVPQEHLGDAEKLKAYLCQLEPPRATTKEVMVPFSEKRLADLTWIAQWVKAHQGKMVLIKLPTSTLSQNVSPELHSSFDAQIDEVAGRLDIPYFDFSVHEMVGIDDRHFVFPGNLFNPDHLNYGGAAILTSHLLDKLDEDLFAPLVSARSK